MTGTFVSLILSSLFLLYPLSQPAASSLALGMELIALFLFGSFILAIVFSWLPLHRTERDMVPRVMKMCYEDLCLKFSMGFITTFLLITFALGLGLTHSYFVHPTWAIAGWMFFCGLVLDRLWYQLRRITSYLNPISALDRFIEGAKKAIQRQDDASLSNYIDGVSEVALKAIHRHSLSVVHEALDKELTIAQLFFDFSKSIASTEAKKQENEAVFSDRVSYIMIYIYHRIDMIFDQALEHRLEATCVSVIAIFGKIAVSAAKYDVSMASTPLRFLGKCAKRCQAVGMEEAPVTASCMLLEVAKVITTEIDLQYYVIVDTFLSIINGMELLTKGAFQQNKEIDIQLLIQPFMELKKLIDSPKMKAHQDYKVISFNIDRVLGEFEALKVVMSTMPKENIS